MTGARKVPSACAQRALVRWLAMLGAFVTLTGAAACALAQKRAPIEQVKSAVVGVGTYQRTRTPQFRFLGTGFAVDDGRSIATNAHVLAKVLDTGADPEVLAILLPSSGSRQAGVIEVTRVAVDEEHDLALLKLKSGNLPALTLRGDDSVQDGDEFLFTGFPIGAVL